MFDQILVPVDRSLLAEFVLPHAIAIAQIYQSRIVLINVLDSDVGGAFGIPSDPWDFQIQRVGAEAYLNEIAKRLQDSGLSTETILLEGKVPERLIQHSNSTSTNLIMLSSHGQGGISSWNMSSVAMKVIQQASTSVMVVHPCEAASHNHANLSYRRILAPVDGSRRAEYGLNAAAYLAQLQDAELFVAHVIKPPELPRRVPLSEHERSLVNQVVASNRLDAMAYLNKLQGSLKCQVTTRLLIEDQVPEALYSLIEQEGIDLVVLNAHGISGNPRSPFGNTAVNFLTNCTAPLLIVQDFQRDLLIESRVQMIASEQSSQPALVSTENSYTFEKF